MSELSEVLPRIAYFLPLVRGARILEIGSWERTRGGSSEALLDAGAASLVFVDPDPASLERAREGSDGAGLRHEFARWEELVPASFDLVWIHDPTFLPLGLQRVVGEGFLVVSLSAGGPTLGKGPFQGMTYGDLVQALSGRFPSVEVVTQHLSIGSVLSPAGAKRPGLVADATFDPSPAASAHLFVAGPRPSGIDHQLVVPLPAEGIFLERDKSLLERMERERRDAELREGARLQELESLRRELAGLRHRQAEAMRPTVPPTPHERKVEELERKLRDLREREEMARSRAEEAEQRLRDVERRAEASRASEADLSVSLRHQHLLVEQAQRNAEGVMDAISERDALLEEWKMRAGEAERRASDLESKLSRLRSLG